MTSTLIRIPSFVIADRFGTSWQSAPSSLRDTMQGQPARKWDRREGKERDRTRGGKVRGLLRGAGGDVETALSNVETTGPKDVAGPRFPLCLSRFFFFCSLSSLWSPCAFRETKRFLIRYNRTQWILFSFITLKKTLVVFIEISKFNQKDTN